MEGLCTPLLGRGPLRSAPSDTFLFLKNKNREDAETGEINEGFS